MKTCSRCQTVKPLTDFSKNQSRYNAWCKPCRAKRETERYHAENYRESSYFSTIKRKYGLTYTDFWMLLDSQGYACAICNVGLSIDVYRNIHVDHCHTTNKVRGLLCVNCNHGLGHFKDNIETLNLAIEYLRVGVQCA